MEPVYLGLGSNLADPWRQLCRALWNLRRLPGLHLQAVSPAYRSAAVRLPGDEAEQPDYLNAVCLVSTRLAPRRLLGLLKALEARQGRRPGRRWGPRPLDLDILLWGGRRWSDAVLSVPHPRLAERRFVLQPLADLDPTLRVPGRGSVRCLLVRCGGAPLQHWPLPWPEGLA
ncbi:MAG: hypothetical protein KatS3mg121_0286 [Gammaproteobacteria bacterium]|nr:MAG: hypothetical protein KatS3mg121_0286 [Gammaproteobacteria bacterium]